ncbi:hypothetical protein LP415_21755 [Polaromonas sp. P1(28)-8]|nr:hypothetical protein LP415_21755 [Polaromonas sp. P1(28)-8]
MTKSVTKAMKSGAGESAEAKSTAARPIRHYLQFSDLNASEYAYLF